MICLLVIFSFLVTIQATIHNFLELGALPDDLSDIAAWHNGRLLNDTLAALKPGGFGDQTKTSIFAQTGKKIHFRGYFAAAQHDFPYDGRHLCKRPRVGCLAGFPNLGFDQNLTNFYICMLSIFHSQVDGTLKFSDNMDDWPRVEDGKLYF